METVSLSIPSRAEAHPPLFDSFSMVNTGIVHRDIKLENYVFSGPGKGAGAVKMIDFGLSRACLDSVTMTQDVGSAVYKAPEVDTGSYTESADLWSFGMVCHMILTGIVSFEPICIV